MTQRLKRKSRAATQDEPEDVEEGARASRAKVAKRDKAPAKRERRESEVEAGGGRGGRASARAARAAPAAPTTVNLVDEDEDEDEFDVKPEIGFEQLTQQYQSQLDVYDTQAVVQKLSAEEKDKLVAEVMRYVLFSQHKDGAPVQRSKISELITTLSPTLKRVNLAGYVIAQAQVKFVKVFGMEMKELSRMAHKKTGKDRTNAPTDPGKEYILKSTLPAAARKRWVDRAEDNAAKAFCITVCALVSISGGMIEEDALWKHLASLGVHQDDEDHPKLGNAKAAIARLCKQRYIMREKASAGGGEDGRDRYGYVLAERALDEIGQDGVDAFVQGIMKGAGDDEGEQETGAAA